MGAGPASEEPDVRYRGFYPGPLLVRAQRGIGLSRSVACKSVPSRAGRSRHREGREATHAPRHALKAHTIMAQPPTPTILDGRRNMMRVLPEGLHGLRPAEAKKDLRLALAAARAQDAAVTLKPPAAA